MKKLLKTNASKLRYTKEEDAIIINEIRKNPNNLMNCFRLASVKIQKKFNRYRNPETSISFRWHLYLRNNPATPVLFALAGPNTINKNRKIVHIGTSDNTKPIAESQWEAFLKIKI